MSFINLLFEAAAIFGYLAFILAQGTIHWFIGLFSRKKTASLIGKNVVVTGAAGGIGQQLSLALYKEGCNLALLDMTKTDNDRVVQDVRASRSNGCKVIGYTCDVTNIQQVSMTFAAIRRDFGKIDIVINNAGIVIGKCLLDESIPELQRTMNVNCMSHFIINKEVLASMISDGSGHIVSIASICGLFGFGPNIAGYVASKYAAVGLMEALDYELHSKGIDCIKFTTVCPYMVQTPMFSGCVPTRFPEFEPILTPEQVAAATIDGVKNQKRVVLIPPRFIAYVLCKLLLPRSICFRLLDFMEINTSMVRFQGRNGTANGH